MTPQDNDDATICHACPICGKPTKMSVWESSDGAYEDLHITCTNPGCDFERWIDGPDS